MSAFPKTPEEIDAAWLSEVLGGTVTSFSSTQVGEGLGIVGRMFRLELEGDGVPSSVVAKYPTTEQMMRSFVAEPLRFYEKEVRFYEELAGDVPVATAQTHFAAVDDDQNFVILFEDLSHMTQFDQVEGCQIDQARTAIDALADIHIKWWASSRFDEISWLPELTDASYVEVLSGMAAVSWPRFVEAVGDRLPADILAYGERLASLIPWFAEESSKDDLTLVHGDYRLDNFFFPTKAGQPPITVIDWQICFAGRAGYDLGYFISQSLTTEDRRKHEQELLDLYTERLGEAGIEYPDLMTDYRRTILYCLMYPIVGFGQVELENERAVELESRMLDRCVTAIQDHDALSLVPS